MNLATNTSGEADAAPEALLRDAEAYPPSPSTVVLEPGKPWQPIRARELWEYRELLYFLTWRDIKVRYKQTALGVLWAIIQPLLTTLVFTIFFGRLAGIDSGGVPYPIFAYAGLLVWTFFANAATNGGNSLVGNSNLITKVYFPRMIIPGSAVAAALLDFVLAFLVLVGLMLYYDVAPSWGALLLLPLLVALTALLAFGVGLWMSALNVTYRDVRYALPFLIQLWMFVSPVIYPAGMFSGRVRRLLALNPLTGIIENFRAVLFRRQLDWHALGVSALVTLVLLVCSAYAFRRMERSFADTI
jgi:lipopolysaccharide transport system permease protein